MKPGHTLDLGSAMICAISTGDMDMAIARKVEKAQQVIAALLLIVGVLWAAVAWDSRYGVSATPVMVGLAGLLWLVGIWFFRWWRSP
jgi:hypothetical protein